MGRQRRGSPLREGASGTTRTWPATSAHMSRCAGGFGRIEEWIVGPYFVDVVDAKVWMFEQVCGLSVDLEGVLVVEQVRIESLNRHLSKCITTGYRSVVDGAAHWRTEGRGSHEAEEWATEGTQPPRLWRSSGGGLSCCLSSPTPVGVLRRPAEMARDPAYTVSDLRRSTSEDTGGSRLTTDRKLPNLDDGGAAVCRASCTREPRTPAALASLFHSAQSADGSMGRPSGREKTRSHSSHAAPAASRACR
jgi:hypothetical protein